MLGRKGCVPVLLVGGFGMLGRKGWVPVLLTVGWGMLARSGWVPVLPVAGFGMLGRKGCVPVPVADSGTLVRPVGLPVMAWLLRAARASAWPRRDY
jgi:hypothetical protein